MTNHDELTVSLGEAFEYDTYLDKLAAARKAGERTVAINELFAIECGRKFTVMKRAENRWCYLLTTKAVYYEHIDKALTNCTYTEFDTYEEAIDFINGFMACLQWMGAFASSTPEETRQEAEHALREVKKARVDNFIALHDLRHIQWEAPVHWREEYKQCRVHELRTIAKERGIDITLKKPQLIDALVRSREEEIERKIALLLATIEENSRNIRALESIIKIA